MKANPGAIPNSAFRIVWLKISDLFKLTKPKLTSLVLFTTLVGFYSGVRGPLPARLLLHALIGTALVAGGATAFNMYRERNTDALMKRTAHRPLPSGRLSTGQALVFSITISTAGFAYLSLIVNPITGFLSALVFACYLFLYTPLKAKTWLSTFVGAIPGALPIVMGWTAANASVSSDTWTLFAIVFLWQIPHFYAIGWMHREDYAGAGLPMISVIDPDGRRTSRLAILFIAILLALTFVPFFRCLAGGIYMAGAILLGLLFLGHAIRFAQLRNQSSARRLFIISAIYLPALLVLLMINKIAPPLI